MTFHVILSALLMFSAACYLSLGLRLVTVKRDVGTKPIGLLFVVAGVWVLGVPGLRGWLPGREQRTCA